MIIYNADGTVLLDVVVDDSSYSYAEVMNRDDVTLEFSLAEYVDIPTGSYIEFGGRTFWLIRPASVTVVNRRNFGYVAVFETDIGKLSLWRVKNTVDGHVKFPLTARPSQHLQLLVDNLNAHEASNIWAIAPGSFDDKEITLSYNRTTIRDAIIQLANQCETEWEVYRDNGSIYLSLGKVEYNAASPLPLAYGEQGGFESGVKRTNASDGLPIEVLFVQGGDRNIDPSTYFDRSSTLLLPRSLSFSFDGEHFNGESGYDSSKGVAMGTDAHGFSVRLASATRNAAEETLDLSDIYPQRVGTVSAVETEESGGDYPFYNIIDTSLGTAAGKINLDYNDYLIEGHDMTIVFQSGMLIGREIGVSEFILEENRGIFKLCQEQIDGFIMPGEGGFVPAIGNTYAIFGCGLPAAYIADAATHSGAEYDMLRKAAKYVYENCRAKQTFKGVLAKVYARKNWQTIGPKIVLGGYVSFTDEDVQETPVLMRIMSYKRYVNNPYKPEIELSNEATKGTVGSSIQSLTNNQARTEREFYNARGFTNRRWRDAKEAISMLAGAVEGFTDGISPVTVQTMSTLVGSTNLQYEFTNSSYTQAVSNEPYFDNLGNLVCGAGYVKHYALGFSENDFVKSNRPATEFYRWAVTGQTFAFTDTTPKYLYIEASKPSNRATAGTAGYILSPTPIPFAPTVAGENYDASHYYLLYGIVSSEIEGSRSISTYNGYTEITPGMLRAMKFTSNDGQQYIDFLNKAFRIGDANTFLGWNVNNDGVLRLKGTIVQSPSGAEFPTPCFRNEYQSNLAYYYGDEVTYNGESWLHIGTTATTGVAPVEGAVWTRTSAKGVNGTAVVAQYSANGTSWHATFAPGDLYMRLSEDGGTTWGSAITVVGEKGDDGASGDYTDYAFAYSPDLTSADEETPPTDGEGHPVSVWYDAPPEAEDGQYLWMRVTKMTYNSTTESYDAGTPHYARISGENGQTPIVADLTNEMDGIGVGTDGILDLDDPTTPLTTSTTFRMFLGLSQVTLTNLSVSGNPTGVTYSLTRQTPGDNTTPYTGEVVFTIDNHTDLSNGRYPISITGSYGSISRTVVYTLMGVRNGEDGASFILVPSCTAVRKTPGDPAVYAPAVVTCGATDSMGRPLSEYYIYYSIDGGAPSLYESCSHGIVSPAVKMEINPATATTSITFLLFLEPRAEVNPTFSDYVDIETINIVSEGTNGTSGTSGKSVRGVSEWQSTGWNGSGEYQGEADSGNAAIDGFFIDIVTFKPTGATEPYYYWCKKTHETGYITPENDTAHIYWEQMNSFSLIATKAMVADYINAKNISAEYLRTNPGQSDYIEITQGRIDVYAPNQVNRVHISNANEIDQSDGTGSFSQPFASQSGSSQSASLTLVSANSLNITASNNTATIGAFSVDLAVMVGNTRVEIDRIVSIRAYLYNSDTGETVTLGDIINGEVHNQASVAVGSTSTSLSAGHWHICAALTISTLNEGESLAGSITATSISGSYLATSSGTKIVGDGFSTVWSDTQHTAQGFEATVNGAKVIRDGLGYDAVGGGALNNLTPITILVACSTVPDSNLIPGALYIKIG